MVDWTAIGVGIAALMALLAIAGVCVAYGEMRRQVRDMQGQITDHDKQIVTLREAIAKASEVGHNVELLSAETRGAFDLVGSKQTASDRLIIEKFEGLRGEVRAFMQGQAALAQHGKA